MITIIGRRKRTEIILMMMITITNNIYCVKTQCFLEMRGERLTTKTLFDKLESHLSWLDENT